MNVNVNDGLPVVGEVDRVPLTPEEIDALRTYRLNRDLPSIPDASVPADVGLPAAAGQPNLGGYIISQALLAALSVLMATSNRRDAVDLLRRELVALLAQLAAAKAQQAINQAAQKVSEPGFWSKLFGKK